MKFQCAFGAGVAMLALASITAHAEILTVAPLKDTTLYSENGTLSNGFGEYLFAGVTASGVSRRALMAFDLSSIAPGSTITSVELTLGVASAAANSASQPFTLYRMSADWGEAGSNAGSPGGSGTPAQIGDATWSHRFYNTQSWSTPGGDFVSTGSASATAVAPTPGGSPTISTWASTPELVADVQSWVNNPGGNYGWILRGSGASAQTAARFASSEYSLGNAFLPTLVVNYAPIPEPASTLLLIPGLAGLTYVVRRRVQKGKV